MQPPQAKRNYAFLGQLHAERREPEQLEQRAKIIHKRRGAEAAREYRRGIRIFRASL